MRRERIEQLPPRRCPDCAEKDAMIKALGHEKDILVARAGAAESRQQAAEYRAQRIVLDAEMKTRAEAAEAALVAVRQAATTVLKAFDDGIFCRNVGGDHSSGWAMRLIGPLQALAQLQELAQEPAAPAPSAAEEPK